MIAAMGFALSAGGNASGQLGDGSTTTRHDYAIVTLDVLMTAVAAGALHSLAVCIDGTAWAWGHNERGQLGDATTTNRALPQQVLEPSAWQGDTIVEYRPMAEVIAVAGGDRYSLALRANGTVMAWGANESGQLGDGTSMDRATPVHVSGTNSGVLFRDIIAIAAGSQSSVALRADGTVWTWGRNDHGQLGDGTRETRYRPVQVLLNRVAAIAARSTHMLALTADGHVFAWGSNARGELGNNTVVASLTPSTVMGHAAKGALADVIAIACGTRFSLALSADGRVWAWGDNQESRLGDGTTHTRLTPVRVLTESSDALGGITQISAGATHSLALQGTGRVFGWGWNNAGRLGDGTTIDRPVAVHVTGNHHFGLVAIATGLMHSLLIRVAADVRTWGANERGQLARDAGAHSPFVTAPFSPEPLADRHHHAAAAGGAEHSVILLPGSPQSKASKLSTRLFTWGANDVGQLGDGSTTDRSTPLDPVNGSGLLTDVKALSAGGQHMLALATDGTIWTWGANNRGQLGIGNTDDQLSPVKVLEPDGTRPLSNVAAIAARQGMSLALRADGTVWAWGANDLGQLGDGTLIDRQSPVLVAGQLFVKSIAAGGSHALTLLANGRIWAFGAGTRGQLGQGAKQDSLTPVAVSEPENGALEPGETWLSKAVAAGGTHSLALRSDGTVWAWGANDRGQLGDETQFDNAGAVRVQSEDKTIGLRGVTAIAAGNAHSMSVSATGKGLEDGGFVRCWGANDEGQLGDGTTTDAPAAVAAWPEHGPALRSVSYIAAGGRHSLAIAPLADVDAERWLRDNKAVRHHLRWEITDPVPESVVYDDWSPAMQAELKEMVSTVLAGKPLGIIDPPPLAYTPADTDLATTRVTAGVAWRIFIAHVAQGIVVDATRAVPWRLADLNHLPELRELFDSRFLFKWNASHAAFEIGNEHGAVTPGDPVTVYDFLAHNDLIGNSRLATIHRVLEWGRENLVHMGGGTGTGLEAANHVDHWQYPGEPPVKRIIEGTIHPEYSPDEPRHWTAGCHGTVGFLRAVLRTVNIPVAYVYAVGHGQPHFLHEDLYIPHGDDVYSTYFKAQPPVPIARLLIDAATHDAWFGPSVDEDTATINIGRLGKQVAVEYLSDGLLRLRCEEIKTGAAPANGQVYEALKEFWTFDQLVEMDLWAKMDAKIPLFGGCIAFQG